MTMAARAVEYSAPSKTDRRLFDAVKNGISVRDAAERYGIPVNQRGMCKCPFHKDRNPSMKVDKRYHCLLYTSPSPRDKRQSRMPSSA